jgi:hypothetical protein
MKMYGVESGDSSELEWIICDRQISVFLENGDCLDFQGQEEGLVTTIEDDGKVTAFLSYRIEIDLFEIRALGLSPDPHWSRLARPDCGAKMLEDLGFEFDYFRQRYVSYLCLNCSRPEDVRPDGLGLRIRTRSRISRRVLLGLQIFNDARSQVAKILKANACKKCQHYHGKEYGGNLLVCAMHPHGPEKERCEDFEIWSK